MFAKIRDQISEYSRFMEFYRESRELQALKIIWQKGGKAPMNALARAMRINSDYARIILLDIGKKDYIDIDRAGICKITEKGKELLKNRGILDQIAREEKERKEEKSSFVKATEDKGKHKTITLNY